jgi:hypothetical protein
MNNERKIEKRNTLVGMIIVTGLMLSMLMAGTASATPQMNLTSGSPPVQLYLGSSYAYTLTTDQPNIMGSSSAYPGWATVTKTLTNNLIFGGTPTSTGNDSFSIQAISQVGGGFVWLNWTVAIVPGINFTSGSPPLAGNVSILYSYTLTTDQPDYLMAGSVYPSWITVTRTTAVNLIFSGTPLATGTYPFVIKVISAINGGINTMTWSVVVTPTITQMTLTSTPPFNASTGFNYHYVLTGDQPNVMGNTSIYPSWVTTVGKTLTNNLIFDGVPSAPGVYPFAIDVISSVGGGDVWQYWNVTVSATPYPTFLQNMGTVYMTLNNTKFTYTPTTAVPASFTIIMMPTWMKWKSGVMSGMPSQVGMYQVEILAENMTYGTKVLQTFTIVVNPTVWPQLVLPNMWLAFIPLMLLLPMMMISSISFEDGRMRISANIFMGATGIGIALLIWCDVFPIWALLITGSLMAVMIMRMNRPAVTNDG